MRRVTCCMGHNFSLQDNTVRPQYFRSPCTRHTAPCCLLQLAYSRFSVVLPGGVRLSLDNADPSIASHLPEVPFRLLQRVVQYQLCRYSDLLQQILQRMNSVCLRSHWICLDPTAVSGIHLYIQHLIMRLNPSLGSIRVHLNIQPVVSECPVISFEPPDKICRPLSYP